MQTGPGEPGRFPVAWSDLFHQPIVSKRRPFSRDIEKIRMAGRIHLVTQDVPQFFLRVGRTGQRQGDAGVVIVLELGIQKKFGEDRPDRLTLAKDLWWDVHFDRQRQSLCRVPVSKCRRSRRKPPAIDAPRVTKPREARQANPPFRIHADALVNARRYACAAAPWQANRFAGSNPLERKRPLSPLAKGVGTTGLTASR